MGRRGPKPGWKGAAVREAAPLPAPAIEQPQTQPPAIASDSRPLGSVHVDGLSGDALKRYARRAGVSQRDVDGLTEDRLRQNVKLRIAEHFDLLSEV